MIMMMMMMVFGCVLQCSSDMREQKLIEHCLFITTTTLTINTKQ